jgi:hypothetical protein
MFGKGENRPPEQAMRKIEGKIEGKIAAKSTHSD